MTNDDGFEAIGIQALLASTKALDPIMVAPKHNCSGMSAAISPVSYTHLTLPTNREV